MRRLLVVACVVGCGGGGGGAGRDQSAARPQAPWPPPAAPPATTDALAKVAWLLGDWRSADGAVEEHWVAANGALYGVRLVADAYEVAIIDDGVDGAATADGVLRLTELGDGHAAREHAADQIARDRVRFVDGDHLVEYVRDDAGLAVRIGNGEKTLAYRLVPVTDPAAAEPAAADRAFAADTLARGVDGWVAAFAARGAQWTDTRVEGHDAIRARMAPTLAKGQLAWAPIASRARGALGLTVGTATFTPNGGAAPAWAGSYVTVWGREVDGVWRVLLDTGRDLQTPAPPTAP